MLPFCIIFRGVKCTFHGVKCISHDVKRMLRGVKHNSVALLGTF